MNIHCGELFTIKKLTDKTSFLTLGQLVKSTMVRFFNMRDDYNRLNRYNGQLYSENEKLKGNNATLRSENYRLKQENMDYKLLRKFFGNEAIDKLLEQAKQPKQREKRFGNKNNFRAHLFLNFL